MGEESKQQPEQEQPKEETKVEEKKEEKVEEKTEEKVEEKAAEEPPKPPAPFVLFVDLHCVGCAKKIERSISKIRGVEGVVIDMMKNEVTIKGVVEPQAVCNKIMMRTKRVAKVLSPLPEVEGEPIPEVVASQVSGLTTVELNVNMHCEACAQQLKRKILKMKGVRTAETEFTSSKVLVTGTMDADRLVDYVYRHTKKQAKIVPPPEPEKPPEEKPAEEKKEDEKPAEAPAEEAKPEEKKEAGEEKKEGPPPEDGKNGAEQEEVRFVEEQMMMQRMNHMQMQYQYHPQHHQQYHPHPYQQQQYHYQQPLYVMERIPAPQLFSDENPNACSIM